MHFYNLASHSHTQDLKGGRLCSCRNAAPESSPCTLSLLDLVLDLLLMELLKSKSMVPFMLCGCRCCGRPLLHHNTEFKHPDSQHWQCDGHMTPLLKVYSSNKNATQALKVKGWLIHEVTLKQRGGKLFVRGEVFSVTESKVSEE